MMPTIILFGPLLGALIAGFGWRIDWREERDVRDNGPVVPIGVPIVDPVLWRL